MEGDDIQQRREVYYWGHVHGVGFRWITHSLAQAHKVTGFVRNISDGRVQIVAEGIPPELDRFLVAVEDRMRHKIEGIEKNITQ